MPGKISSLEVLLGTLSVQIFEGIHFGEWGILTKYTFLSFSLKLFIQSLNVFNRVV